MTAIKLSAWFFQRLSPACPSSLPGTDKSFGQRGSSSDISRDHPVEEVKQQGFAPGQSPIGDGASETSDPACLSVRTVRTVPRIRVIGGEEMGQDTDGRFTLTHGVNGGTRSMPQRHLYLTSLIHAPLQKDELERSAQQGATGSKTG